MKNTSVFLMVFVALWFAPQWAMRSAQALEMTPELLFSQIEKRTETIDSMIAELELASGSLKANVEMAIQSPDKFAMDFPGRYIQVVFDGERLWIYVASLREAFTLDTSSAGGSWISDALRDYVNPKRLITQVTRHTLFSLFDISIQASPSYSLVMEPSVASEAANGYCLRFQPIGGERLRGFFDIGFYEMVFSRTSYLPILVFEFSPGGKIRGILQVIRYRLNETLPKERFVFQPPEGTHLVPLSEVLAEKLEQAKDLAKERAGTMMEEMKKQMTDWGL